jgi:hypothetical protein
MTNTSTNQLPQLAIDWEDSSADAYFFLERTLASRRNTDKRRIFRRIVLEPAEGLRCRRHQPRRQSGIARLLKAAWTWWMRHLVIEEDSFRCYRIDCVLRYHYEQSE